MLSFTILIFRQKADFPFVSSFCYPLVKISTISIRFVMCIDLLTLDYFPFSDISYDVSSSENECITF